MQESAFLDPPWLLEREGSGYVQVTDLLYRVAQYCDGERTIEQIAERISSDGKPVSPATVRRLIAQLLIPRGLVETADGVVVPVATGGLSPLALNMRVKMIRPETITPLTNVLRWLYWPPIMLSVLAVAVGTEIWIYGVHGIGAGLHDALYAPGLMLLLLLVTVLSAAFHELGHAAALHYSGGRIKGMGAGIYIVYPAFFTDVSDNYRLTRWKRVLTDLGGFYFNLIFSLGVMGLYVLTGHEFLLLMVVLINLEIIHQLMPFLRLDGYWTLADITGVPDFFSQMSAFVRSVLPVAAWKGRKLPPLKPWAKVVFGAYTVITIPLLVLVLILMLRSVPRVLGTAWDSFGQQGNAFLTAQISGDLLSMLGSAGQAVLLAIPSAGLVYTLFSIGRRLVGGLWRWGQPSLARRAVSGICYVALGGVLSFMWIPQVSLSLPGNGNQAPPSGLGPISPVSWEPIRPDEPGRIQDVVSVAQPPAAEPTSSVRPASTPATGPTTQPAVPADAESRATEAVPTVVEATAVEATAVATRIPPITATQSAGTPASTRTALPTATPAGVNATSTVVRATSTPAPTRAPLR